jgi:hypothetical protein
MFALEKPPVEWPTGAIRGRILPFVAAERVFRLVNVGRYVAFGRLLT